MKIPKLKIPASPRVRASIVVVIALIIALIHLMPPAPVLTEKYDLTEARVKQTRNVGAREHVAAQMNDEKPLKLTKLEPVVVMSPQEIQESGGNDQRKAPDVTDDLTEMAQPPAEMPLEENAPVTQAAPQAQLGTAILPNDGIARIALIIDDIGMDLAGSRAAIELPAPVTLAVLPYAVHAAQIAQDGKEKGHEILLHMPMEPMDKGLDMGPVALKSGMSGDEIAAMLAKGIEAVPGIIGMNNHMGSLLTQDRAAMDAVMAGLKARGLAFIDSRTHGASVGAYAARDAGVTFATRDVFLDHSEARADVDRALKRAEDHARKHGIAVAIGHPKKNTLEALAAWIPTLEGKGIALVPISVALVRGQGAEEIVSVPEVTGVDAAQEAAVPAYAAQVFGPPFGVGGY